MKWIESINPPPSPPQKKYVCIIHDRVSRYETRDYTRSNTVVCEEQRQWNNKYKEGFSLSVSLSQPLFLTHLRFVQLWNSTVHAEATLNQLWWLHLPWHIICYIQSFSWRTQRLAFVKWTIWRVCLTTPLQCADKWFWFARLKDKSIIFQCFFLSRDNFHIMSLLEKTDCVTSTAVRLQLAMCLCGNRHEGPVG